MNKIYTINPGQVLKPEQVEEVLEASKYPITFDEDCPELSPALQKSVKESIAHRNKLENA